MEIEMEVVNFSAVDRLGVLMAEIARLEKEASKIKETIKAHGVGTVEGDLFQATVSVSERATLDMDAVRAKLSPQFITAHTRLTQVVAVRVAARKERKVA
jgi:hypothetical protein